MNSELKQNKKIGIGEFLNSLFYSSQIKKSRIRQEQTINILNKIRSFSLSLITSLLILVLLLIFTVVILTVLKSIETKKRIQQEDAFLELSRDKDRMQIELNRSNIELKLLREELDKSKILLSEAKDLIQTLFLGLKEERSARIKTQQELLKTKSVLSSLLANKNNVNFSQQDLIKKEKKEPDKEDYKYALKTKGKILVVDKNSGSIVVDFGKKDNLSEGMVLAVYRNNQFIARLLVVRVEENVSITRILPFWRDVTVLEEGDEVRLLE